MEYQATAKYLRTSPRKMRLVASSVKKMNPEAAIIGLKQLNKLAAKPLGDVIYSALSNARQKSASMSDLVIKSIDVFEGPVMKRWHAVSRGQAHAYKKRMSHVRVILTDENNKIQKLPAKVEVKK